MTLREYIEKLAEEQQETSTGFASKKELIEFLINEFPELKRSLSNSNNAEAVWVLYITECMKYAIDDNS